jgi:hypothetical protein
MGVARLLGAREFVPDERIVGPYRLQPGDSDDQMASPTPG